MPEFLCVADRAFTTIGIYALPLKFYWCAKVLEWHRSLTNITMKSSQQDTFIHIRVKTCLKIWCKKGEKIVLIVQFFVALFISTLLQICWFIGVHASNILIFRIQNRPLVTVIVVNGLIGRVVEFDWTKCFESRSAASRLLVLEILSSFDFYCFLLQSLRFGGL